jgi:predicted SAM-dependent methyltransferase
MKIEIGGQRNIPGWTELNNRADESGPNFNIITDEFDIPDNSVDYFYMSHVIEHIPIINAENVLRKMFSKLKTGGKLRITCPDMEIILKAYVNKDKTIFNNQTWQTGTVPEYYTRLGIGGYVISQFMTGQINENSDSYLFTERENGKYICSFSHVAGWDYEMLHTLLKIVGFSTVERTEFEEMDKHKGLLGQLCVNAYK